jgi:hypothetical protein
MKGETFAEVLQAAVDDFAKRGYQSAEQLASWAEKLRRSAQLDLTPLSVVEENIERLLRRDYAKIVDRAGFLNRNEGPKRFTIDIVKPKLRHQVDKAIMASADLIKRDRDVAIEDTIRRLSGWATSIPPGSRAPIDRVDVKTKIRAPLRQLSFQERRVAIDQSAKLVSSLSRIIAVDGGALAGQWHSHKYQPGYNSRPDHDARHDHIFAVRGNWALEKGFMKPGPDGYTDEIEEPAQFVFCRCFYVWLFALSDLPPNMITQKGRDEMARVKSVIERM